MSWSVISGVLPPGLTLSSSGSVTGAATVNGTNAFSVQASDSANPPQTATSQQVMQSSGGLPPLTGGILTTTQWVGINVNPSTGVFSGSAPVTGTFTVTVGVNDQTQHPASQQVTLNVVPRG